MRPSEWIEMSTVAEAIPSIARQIADMEMSVNSNAFAYSVGFLHGQQKSFEAQTAEVRRNFEIAKEAADAYEGLAKVRFPGFGGFVQLRIGLMPEWGDMSIMSILSEADVELLSGLQDLSREIEAHFLETKSVILSFLTMACDHPDDHLLASDFPLFRVPNDA